MDNGEDYEEDVLLTTLLVCTVKYKRRQQRRRRWWVRPFLLDREEHGQACRLAAELRAHDEEYFRDYNRMPPSTFDTLLELVRDKIRKTNTNWRKAITPKQRLIVTLSYVPPGSVDGEDWEGELVKGEWRCELSEKQRVRDESQVYEVWVGTARPRLASFVGVGSLEQRVTFTSADDVPLSRAILRAHPQTHSNKC
ncbi:hypothetical protein HPB47_010120 [Ixodes persulcatus]|uniref:Uncharacterized protein n=1 Tax=Ixodes persulcatus TaxID=34615 RepID=A0AC60P013_IXOPE|nr:hypothetical protein HPB47_010120 [Ixodes persulcatus]